MRDIKFRAWDKPNKRMLWSGIHDKCWYATAYNDEGGSHCVGGKKQDDAHWFDLMQYTGLKDKNGKEIYEGDIYSYKFTEDKRFKPEIDVFNSIKDLYYNELIKYRVEEGEIIGNIYENPELLKGEK